MQILMFQHGAWVGCVPPDSPISICHRKDALRIGIDSLNWIEWLFCSSRHRYCFSVFLFNTLDRLYLSLFHQLGLFRIKWQDLAGFGREGEHDVLRDII